MADRRAPRPEFETFIPMGAKKTKTAEKGFGRECDFSDSTVNGVKHPSRCVGAYNFNRNMLADNMSGMIDAYNEQVFKWERSGG